MNRPTEDKTITHAIVLDSRGFYVHYEEYKEFFDTEQISFHTLFAYARGGGFIGDVNFAIKLKALGIEPELIDETDGVCQIGFCDHEQKWYGYSHRAMCGFGVGDEVKDGDLVSSHAWSEDYLRIHPEADRSLPVGFKAITLQDSRRMAIAYADAVS